MPYAIATREDDVPVPVGLSVAASSGPGAAINIELKAISAALQALEEYLRLGKASSSAAKVS